MIAIATYFTKGWTYSVESWLNHVHSAAAHTSGAVIVSTDHSQECLDMVSLIKERMGSGWGVHHCKNNIPTDRHPAYKESAQLIIAKIQNSAFSKAREIGASQLWSVESDVLVPPNALKISQQAIEFDDGYYDVAMVTYFNGQFLGGRGTTQNQICPDVYDDERVITKDLKKRLKARKFVPHPTSQQISEWGELDKAVKACPSAGNIFQLQAKKWRRRGWMEAAYPGIGKGAILPTDWVGLGCTLLSKRALSMATYDGYELQGTQDLFLSWERWHKAGLRMCVIPHAVCSHVKRGVDKDGLRTDEILIHQGYHEPDGELVGHLRVKTSKYLQEIGGA